MSKKKKKSKGKQRKGESQSGPRRLKTQASIQEAAENRTAVAANVAWMLSLMSTVAAEGIGLACRWYTSLVEPVELLTVLSGVMLFVAVISGTLTLVMIPVVLKFSKARPPAIIVQIAVVAGALPILVVFLRSVLQQ